MIEVANSWLPHSSNTSIRKTSFDSAHVKSLKQRENDPSMNTDYIPCSTIQTHTALERHTHMILE